MQHTLLLDTSIRDWVVIPMVILLILVGIGRHYVQILIKSKPVVNSSTIDEMRHKQVLMKAQAFRNNGKF